MPIKPAAKTASKTGPKTGPKAGPKAAGKPGPKRGPAQAMAAAPGEAALEAGVMEAGGEEGARRAPGGLKIKALVDRVTASSGVKRKEVRTVIDAVLAEIGATLGRGEGMSLPGLGHLRVARKATAENPVMTLKLRQGEGAKGKDKAEGESPEETAEEDVKEPLAAQSDQG